MTHGNTVLIMKQQVKRWQTGLIRFRAGDTGTVFLAQGLGASNMVGMMMGEKDEVETTVTNHLRDRIGLAGVNDGNDSCLRVSQKPGIIIACERYGFDL